MSRDEQYNSVHLINPLVLCPEKEVKEAYESRVGGIKAPLPSLIFENLQIGFTVTGEPVLFRK